MVRVAFKLTGRQSVELPLEKPERLSRVLERSAAEAGEELGEVMVVCQGKLMKPDDLVKDGVLLEVFPAIAGG